LSPYRVPRHGGPGHDHSSGTHMDAAFHLQFQLSCSESSCVEPQVCSVPLDSAIGQHLTHLPVSPADVWSERQEFLGFTYPFSHCSIQSPWYHAIQQ
jgi:hypothetical protein